MKAATRLRVVEGTKYDQDPLHHLLSSTIRLRVCMMAVSTMSRSITKVIRTGRFHNLDSSSRRVHEDILSGLNGQNIDSQYQSLPEHASLRLIDNTSKDRRHHHLRITAQATGLETATARHPSHIRNQRNRNTHKARSRRRKSVHLSVLRHRHDEVHHLTIPTSRRCTPSSRSRRACVAVCVRSAEIEDLAEVDTTA